MRKLFLAGGIIPEFFDYHERIFSLIPISIQNGFDIEDGKNTIDNYL